MSMILHVVRRAIAAAAVVLAVVSPALAETATPLVSTAWLKSRLGTPDIVILDIRSAIDGGGAAAYAKGHIPGAVHADYDKAGWRVTRNGVPFLLPTVAELEKLIGELGIDEDTHVVVVPAGVHATDFGAAARVYWTLKVAGASRLSILDGGYAAWIADSNSIETAANKPAPRIFTASLDRTQIAETSDVQAIERSGDATLLDARPATFFSGKQRAPAARAYGHIPGAFNLDSATFYDLASNRLKPRAELAAIASSVATGPVVTYCNTGHWASTNWFVLSELLGRNDTRLYYGSMVEWTADPSRPIVSSRTKWDDLKKTLGFGS